MRVDGSLHRLSVFSLNLPLFIFGVLFFLSIRIVDGHPQCLDSRPPFEAEQKLQFCPAYSTFGCCTNSAAVELRNRYTRIKQLIHDAGETELWTQCANYTQTFLCQTCSPYAAHIFDSEIRKYGTKVTPRAFPGLCQDYCSVFYQKCRGLVKYFLEEAGGSIAESKMLNKAVNEGVFSFCNSTKLPDLDYCYPELLSNEILNGNITISQVTKPGCLCLKRFNHELLRNPVFLKHANDGSNRIFVGEQIGVVHIFNQDGTKLPRPFVDIRLDIQTTAYPGDERGMLGMAFHPQYSKNGKFYIYYSTKLGKGEYLRKWEGDRDHKIRIEEFKVNSTNPNEVDYSYSRIVLEIFEPYWNHNGGEILFGDDNYMYLFVGDGGSGGDPKEFGQNMTALLGKVLRIDVDNINHAERKEYSIPPDNPFADGVDALPEIYAFGVRNIWRCGKDRGDPNTGYGKGRIMCGDVGQSAREEINLLEKGANYGWNIREGSRYYCSNCTRALPRVPLTDPVFDYPHSMGKSVTGGHFYRGCENPNLNGFYIYGDFMTGKLWRLTENQKTKKWKNKELTMCGPDKCTPPLLGNYSVSIISFGEDQQGEIYMLTTAEAKTSSAVGSIYKIVDPSRRGNPARCISATVPPQTTEKTKPTRPTTQKHVNGAKKTKANVVSSDSKLFLSGAVFKPSNSLKHTADEKRKSKPSAGSFDVKTSVVGPRIVSLTDIKSQKSTSGVTDKPTKMFSSDFIPSKKSQKAKVSKSSKSPKAVVINNNSQKAESVETFIPPVQGWNNYNNYNGRRSVTVANIIPDISVRVPSLNIFSAIPDWSHNTITTPPIGRFHSFTPPLSVNHNPQNMFDIIRMYWYPVSDGFK